jgi:hypothetical protein
MDVHLFYRYRDGRSVPKRQFLVLYCDLQARGVFQLTKCSDLVTCPKCLAKWRALHDRFYPSIFSFDIDGISYRREGD